MIDINNFDAIEIGLASSKQIRSWSSGEVTKPETINYRTLKPEKDGLFCERIFGPTKDWECYCGKYKRVRYKGIVCERCGVEVTRSKVRRERMGHIDLAAPVSHIWFFKGVPSRIGYLIDMAPKELEKVLYFAASVITWVDEEARSKDLGKLEKEVEKQAGEYEREREQRTQELNESLNRRLAYLGVAAEKDEEAPPAGTTDGFNEDDELWADSVANVKRMKAEDREKTAKELRKTFEAEISDTEAYLDEAAERLREVFKIFSEMKPKDVINDETTFRELKDRSGSPFGWGEYFRGGMGAESVRDLLDQVDLDAEAELLEETINTSKGQKQARAVKRLKVVDAFLKSANKPEWMVLDVVPVIPPELRPMVQLDGGRFATSDLNDLYRRVINRNNRLKRLLDLGAPEIIINNEKRMLQEAVDALFDNGRRGRPVTGPGNRALKSLSDMLKGKQGRFRQNLLGKRVDYSGRSVIVVGPQLQLQQCGLPKQMALELFKPFVMKRLVDLEYAQNIKSAKRMVERARPQVWDVLEEVIKEHPVFLNRAPTLHRLGIQAFEPVLVEGKAIQIHPLVCAAFNADFDGDQMAVHLPLSAEAQAEARLLMLSAHNILSPASGRPIAVPSQDMIIGVYYLTEQVDGGAGTGRVFASLDEALAAYEERFSAAGETVSLHTKVKIRMPAGKFPVDRFARPLEDGTPQSDVLREYGTNGSTEVLVEVSLGRFLLNTAFPDDFPFVNSAMKKLDITEVVGELVVLYDKAIVAESLDKLKALGYEWSTRAGLTISISDVTTPQEKATLLEQFEGEAAKVESQYDRGIITDDERRQQEIEIWTDATNQVTKAMQDLLQSTKFNPIDMMVGSGARGNVMQVRQIAGMRGLVANPRGEIIPRPIKSNFREGLSVLEYFISTHGARKGLADTALRTADSGYLTRRLVDVAQELIVREIACDTMRGIWVEDVVPGAEALRLLETSLLGRCLAEDVSLADGTVPPPNTEVTDEVRHHLQEDTRATRVRVRSVLTCETVSGVCSCCYGRMLATGKIADLGEAIGIVAAQSIGEPGTQLTMRTFHTGGVAGEDITHGLPRVVELFEARTPKSASLMADVSGVVRLGENEKGERVITVVADDGTEFEYAVSRRAHLGVRDGQEVQAGDRLVGDEKSPLDPKKLLEIKGVRETQQYLVEEVQRVYRDQGVSIHDKHIEVIVRQMLRRVTVSEPGDSKFLPGEKVDARRYAEENRRLVEENLRPAEGRPELMGITKASLATDSWLSAASFQETTRVLTEAAIEGRSDGLEGLKENVIIGKLIPAGTGMPLYRDIKTEAPEYEPLPFYTSEVEEEMDLATWLREASSTRSAETDFGILAGGEPIEGAPEAEFEPTGEVHLGGDDAEPGEFAAGE